MFIYTGMFSLQQNILLKNQRFSKASLCSVMLAVLHTFAKQIFSSLSFSDSKQPAKRYFIAD